MNSNTDEINTATTNWIQNQNMQRIPRKVA